MKTAEHIIETVDKLVRKYHTRDPYELCQLLGIKIHYYDLQKKLKGFFYYQSRQKNIVIDHNVNGILERILVAHELGHAVLHTKIAMMHGFQEMEVFDDRSIEENEANFFAAELLLEDGKVLECLSEHTFFETAKMLYVPAALLDYKFSLLHEKGELVNSMYLIFFKNRNYNRREMKKVKEKFLKLNPFGLLSCILSVRRFTHGRR